MAIEKGPQPARVLERRLAGEPSMVSIDLFWIPLGAGGASFVRLNGRIYEGIRASLERRPRLDLYHTALEVHAREGRFVIEMTPIPDADPAARGVVMEGPVGSRLIARFRVFRYEVRRWRNGVIVDVDEAVGSPQPLSDDPDQARRLLDLTASTPALVWGRDELGTGGMWNSNSVISWLLARSGLTPEAIRPPAGGRAPGWEAGIISARSHQPTQERTPEMIGQTGPPPPLRGPVSAESSVFDDRPATPQVSV